MLTLAQIAEIRKRPSFKDIADRVMEQCFAHGGVVFGGYLRDVIVPEALGIKTSKSQDIDIFMPSKEHVDRLAEALTGWTERSTPCYQSSPLDGVCLKFMSNRNEVVGVDILYDKTPYKLFTEVPTDFSMNALRYDGKELYAEGPYTVDEVVDHIERRVCYPVDGGFSSRKELERAVEIYCPPVDQWPKSHMDFVSPADGPFNIYNCPAVNHPYVRATLRRNYIERKGWTIVETTDKLELIPLDQQPRITLDKLRLKKREDTLKFVLDTAYENKLKVFGGYVRDHIVPVACGEVSRKNSDSFDIDLFTDDEEAADKFLQSISSFSRVKEVVDDSQDRYFATHSRRIIEVQHRTGSFDIDLVVTGHLYIYDFHVNLLYFDGERVGILGDTPHSFKIGEIVDDIVNKVAWPFASCPPDRLNRFKAEGWNIDEDRETNVIQAQETLESERQNSPNSYAGSLEGWRKRVMTMVEMKRRVKV